MEGLILKVIPAKNLHFIDFVLILAQTKCKLNELHCLLFATHAITLNECHNGLEF